MAKESEFIMKFYTLIVKVNFMLLRKIQRQIQLLSVSQMSESGVLPSKDEMFSMS
jgi:hypothetical protein